MINPGEVQSSNYLNEGMKDNPGDIDEFLSSAMDTGPSAWKAVNKLREMSANRKSMYQEYRNIGHDVLISSALELYADDATQMDSYEDSRIIWVESDNNKLEKKLNNVIEELEIPDRLWGWAYAVAQSGDFYLERFFNTKEVEKDGETKYKITGVKSYVEEFDKPEDIFELTYEGKTEGYAIIKDTNTAGTTKYEIHPPNKFVHFHVKKQENYEELTLTNPKDKDENRTYKVLRGSSFLENVIMNYRILRLLEDSMIVSRLIKSSILRIFELEVGNKSPKKAKLMIKRFKRLLNTEEKVDLDKGDYDSVYNPGPMTSPLVLPVKNGIGSVQVNEIGGQADVKSIVDVDYFRNKVFAGLKIPKAYLGWEEELPGSMGDTSLTKLDIRYSRTIKRLQKALIQGVTDLLNLYLIDTGDQKKINDFQVKLVRPTTAEDASKVKEMDSRIRLVESIMNIVDRYTERESEIDKEGVMTHLFRKILKQDDIADLVDVPDPEPEDDKKDKDKDSEDDEAENTNESGEMHG